MGMRRLSLGSLVQGLRAAIVEQDCVWLSHVLGLWESRALAGCISWISRTTVGAHVCRIHNLLRRILVFPGGSVVKTLCFQC